MDHIEAGLVGNVPLQHHDDDGFTAGNDVDEDNNSVKETWFENAQQFMVDPSFIGMNKLIGKLYGLSGKVADSDTDNFMRNKDAEAYADAFYQALENQKHGTQVQLRRSLWGAVPKTLQKHLRDVYDDE